MRAVFNLVISVGLALAIIVASQALTLGQHPPTDDTFNNRWPIQPYSGAWNPLMWLSAKTPHVLGALGLLPPETVAPFSRFATEELMVFERYFAELPMTAHYRLLGVLFLATFVGCLCGIATSGLSAASSTQAVGGCIMLVEAITFSAVMLPGWFVQAAIFGTLGSALAAVALTTRLYHLGGWIRQRRASAAWSPAPATGVAGSPAG